MIKYKQLPDNILKLIPEAVTYLHSHPKVIFSYLFGSLSKGKPSPLSDVDTAVFLKKAEKVADRKIEILGKLIEILETDEIDLVVLNTANLPLVMGILKNKKLIVDKDPFARHLFESLTMRKYFDFSINESAQLRRRYFFGFKGK
jgi:predicted nucleotidyltransferase